ncbi:unnamed protein product [Arabidopsis halleri]
MYCRLIKNHQDLLQAWDTITTSNTIMDLKFSKHFQIIHLDSAINSCPFYHKHLFIVVLTKVNNTEIVSILAIIHIYNL